MNIKNIKSNLNVNLPKSTVQVKTSKVKVPRVLVAMSGGVDSSVAAALLVKQGYEVIGVTMQVWDYSKHCEIEEGNGTCCSSVDVEDARDVADKIGIPFYVINCEKSFQTHVIDPFIADYLKGHTPLPCVNCNTFLKFDYLFQKMWELDCDFLATGHYAQKTQLKDNNYGIQTSQDSWKDQTYFLFTMAKQRIAKLLFPIGHLKKSQVRQYAQEFHLVNAHKKDSTGICFIGRGGYGHFIENQIGKDAVKKGPICLYPTGEVLGTHHGIHHFTYGQRRGLGIEEHTASDPLYVIKIDGYSQTVWVGDEKYLMSDRMEVQDINFLDNIQNGQRLKVKIRYQHVGDWAYFSKDDQQDAHRAFIVFEKPQRAITPGQAAVFYKDRQLVGGGWISDIS